MRITRNYTKYELIFYLKLTYTGSDTILFNPANIYLISGNGHKISAVDPESEIFQQQIHLSKAESRRKNSILLAGALAIASTAAVAAISDNNAPTDDHNSTYIQDNTYIYINNRPDPNPILPPDIEFWKNHALRKSTITKSFQVEGMLVFPRMDEMRDFRMIILIKGQNREVAFRQRIYLP